jgi:hypothetical protein
MWRQRRRRRAGKVKLAARQGLASGLRDHLPGAVGLVVKGIPLCALAAFAHLVLEIGIPGTAISTVLAYFGLGKMG